MRLLAKDPHFIESMNDVESRAWTSFKSMIQNFLGNRKAKNYGQLLAKSLDVLQISDSEFPWN